MVTLQSAARIIAPTPGPEKQDLRRQTQPTDNPSGQKDPLELSDQDLFGVQTGQYIKKSRNQVLSDIDELSKNNQWEDLLSLYHPVDEKLPDLVAADMDRPVRLKVAFALGQAGRFDQAIQELTICVTAEPDHFMACASLAYTAYNSLWTAKNKKVFLAGKAKADRIGLAHEYFQKTQELRPDTVTNFYREGMLFAQIENKPKPGLARFEQACANWEGLTAQEREQRHQEKKNYIKSLYRSASLLLAAGDSGKALDRITLCLKQDEPTNHISLAFKYFALGKVHFHLDRFDDARSALMFAMQSSGKGQPNDFINELLARTCLALGQTNKALETIDQVPEKFRRPYYRWTEADVLCNAGRFDQARQILTRVAEKDGRSRHKCLIRLSKIEYHLKNYDAAAAHAARACEFFTNNFGNPYLEGLFWQSLCTLHAGDRPKADQLLIQLEKSAGHYYPKLDQLRAMIRQPSSD